MQFLHSKAFEREIATWYNGGSHCFTTVVMAGGRVILTEFSQKLSNSLQGKPAKQAASSGFDISAQSWRTSSLSSVTMRSSWVWTLGKRRSMSISVFWSSWIHLRRSLTMIGYTRWATYCHFNRYLCSEINKAMLYVCKSCCLLPLNW